MGELDDKLNELGLGALRLELNAAASKVSDLEGRIDRQDEAVTQAQSDIAALTMSREELKLVQRYLDRLTQLEDDNAPMTPEQVTAMKDAVRKYRRLSSRGTVCFQGGGTSCMICGTSCMICG